MFGTLQERSPFAMTIKHGFAALLAALAISPLPAQAQIFAPPPSAGIGGGGGKTPATIKSRRLQLGTYFASWDAPPGLQDLARGIPKIAFLTGVSTVFANVDSNADSSVLVTADYYVNDNLSVGGWWNPNSGSFSSLATNRFTTASGRIQSNYYDFHAAYHFKRERVGGSSLQGLSFQVGYQKLNTDIDALVSSFNLKPVPLNIQDNRASINFWLNYARPRPVTTLRLSGKKYPVSLFTSYGYYGDRDFGFANNLILGGSVKLSDFLSFNSSVWFNGLGEQSNQRVSIGLSGTF
jgi:hypothetical protein